MKLNKQYIIDLSLFIGSVIVLLYLLTMNFMSMDHNSNDFINQMEWFTISIFFIGAFIPMIVAFRYILKKINSRTLSILTLLFSLLTALLIGYTKLI